MSEKRCDTRYRTKRGKREREKEREKEREGWWIQFLTISFMRVTEEGFLRQSFVWGRLKRLDTRRQDYLPAKLTSISRHARPAVIEIAVSPIPLSEQKYHEQMYLHVFAFIINCGYCTACLANYYTVSL